jgi:YesN/AraC family two-component response regulator
VTSQKAIKNILAKRKYEVYTAQDGEEALGKAKTLGPDLIILDIRMPKIDGIEVLKEIRKFNAGVKIIIVTAFQSPQISQEAAKYNIFDYIVKPLSGEKLIEVVEKALQR